MHFNSNLTNYLSERTLIRMKAAGKNEIYAYVQHTSSVKSHTSLDN
jgi:hypothetical protein